MNINSIGTDDLADIIRTNVMVAAPRGLVQVHLGGGNTGAEANEHAVAAAFQHYSTEHGVGVGNLAAIGFDNSNHGTTTGALSFSSERANTHNLPAFPWPKAQFPQLKFPIWKYENENIAEEQRCVESFRKLISAHKASGGHVGAVIIAPTSAIDNQFATPNFFKGIRNIAKSEGIPFIVDETETGMGSSGKNWGHDQWYLSDEQTPDFVTFGGKSGLGGFYSTLNYRLNNNAT